ncbi:uncharacterized protein L199_002143 [Kwoniella botswanensis]|uniref:uncharacterized protein n=1 Tax=Kwoniella botswanensis TaxID=1268659 RepID=UPI00315DCE71
MMFTTNFDLILPLYKGTKAAAIQASIGNVPSGSLFAIYQKAATGAMGITAIITAAGFILCREILEETYPQFSVWMLLIVSIGIEDVLTMAQEKKATGDEGRGHSEKVKDDGTTRWNSF